MRYYLLSLVGLSLGLVAGIVIIYYIGQSSLPIALGIVILARIVGGAVGLWVESRT